MLPPPPYATTIQADPTTACLLYFTYSAPSRPAQISTTDIATCFNYSTWVATVEHKKY